MNKQQSKKRDELMVEITSEWQERRYVGGTYSSVAYNDLLDEGIIEECEVPGYRGAKRVEVRKVQTP